MQMRPFQSLRAKFAVVVALTVLVITCIFGSVIGASAISRHKEQTGHQLAEYAASMIDRLDRDMHSRAKELSVLSALEALRNPQNVAEARSLLNHLNAQFPSYSWIGLTDAQGTVVASTGRLLEGLSIAHRPVFVEGRDKTFIGDVHEAVLLAKLLPNPSGEAMKFVDISMPILDKTGNFIGVLGTHLSWQWAAEIGRTMLEPLKKSLPGVEFLVISKDGIVLLGPKQLIGKPSEAGIDNESNTRWTVSEWQDGNTYVVGAAKSTGIDGYPGLGWTVVTRQPAEAAFAEANGLRVEILLWGSLLSITFAMLGWFVAGVITRPLNQIAEAATRLSEGADVDIPLVKGSLEVEKLSIVIRHLVENLTQKKGQLALIRGVAYRDTVTGLPNRAALDNYVNSLQKEPGQQPAFGVLCLDLDGFKSVNDRFGHAVGDALLHSVGLRLSANVRDGDIAVRHGGDEFVLLLRLKAGESLGHVQSAAQRIIKTIAEPVPLAGAVIRVGCSIGGAVWTEGDFADVLAKADEALYRAKRAGKSQAQFYPAGGLADTLISATSPESV
ncbi:sensor domain-containing diguanylate cyclase [Pseudomonas huanghezhanensis]|uniref:sensor domain-containing diguanylate cyclase n=1 Tax=Pseudomonas huanghezhanensis TaxID=3002903 RepID=UPI0022855A79|nr:GGDEF domain-containing protein [Pseudomonas sp. BSw22131]